MPAIMGDPASPTLQRESGPTPFPDPEHPGLPDDVLPRQVTLRDGHTVATVIPVASSSALPGSLLRFLCDQFAREVEGGDTYPQYEPMPHRYFTEYWFGNVAAVMVLGRVGGAAELGEEQDWARHCLGTFYIKPNYAGRSSHVCNAGFVVAQAARNRGVGRRLGEAYLDWAPKLGYSYSVFNLVYETNVASCRVWDSLGFDRIGRVPRCGRLRSYPDRLVDAIIYGRELGGGDAPVSPDHPDTVEFQLLEHGRYWGGC